MKGRRYMMFAACAVYGLSGSGFAGNVYYLSAAGNNGYHLANAAYWVDAGGKPAGEAGAALDADDDFVVAYQRFLRTPNSNSASASVGFTGNALYVGDRSLSGNDRMGRIAHYSGNACVVDYGTRGGLVMRYGEYVFQNASRCRFTVNGNLAVDSTEELPASICNNTAYSNQVAVWTGTLSGGATSYFRIGHDAARTGKGDRHFEVWFAGDVSGFKGRMEVVTPAPSAVAPDFTVRLGMGGTFGGTLAVGSHSTLTTPSNALSVAGLTLADGARLQVLGASPAVHTSVSVTESFSIAGTVKLELPDLPAMFRTDGETNSIVLLSVPLGSGLSASSFELVCADECLRFFTLEPGVDGNRECLLLNQHAPVVTLAASDVASKDGSVGGAVPPSAFADAASWSDGKLPHTGAHYYLRRLSAVDTDIAFARTPRTDGYVFPGMSLVVGDHTLLLQCGANLTVSNLAVLSGGCFHLEQQVASPASFKGDVMEFPSGTAYLGAYSAKTWQIYPQVKGSGRIFLNGIYGGTSRPDGSVTFIGGTSGFLGTFKAGHYDVSRSGNSYNATYPVCHYILDGCFCTARRSSSRPDPPA